MYTEHQKELQRQRSRRFYNRHKEEERERKCKYANTSQGKAVLKKARDIYRQTTKGKKKRSLQSSRRHQRLKNDHVYSQKRNELNRNSRKKPGPAQDRRRAQWREYGKRDEVKRRTKDSRAARWEIFTHQQALYRLKNEDHRKKLQMDYKERRTAADNYFDSQHLNDKLKKLRLERKDDSHETRKGGEESN
jgi:hypothetical protein